MQSTRLYFLVRLKKIRLVKYHQKNLDVFQIEKVNGIYQISPSGVEGIRSRLRKESYEEKVLRRLHMIEYQQELM